MTDFDGPLHLILVEEFKAKMNADVKVYLGKQNAVDLKTAAAMVDDYALTHKKQDKSGHTSLPVKKQWLSNPRVSLMVMKKFHFKRLPVTSLAGLVNQRQSLPSSNNCAITVSNLV